MMEDYESIAQGLKTNKPAPVRVQDDHLVLSHPELSTIARLPNSPEYNVLLRIMEGEIEKLETTHMKVWRDKELFERTGLIAVAARGFFESIQVEVNYHSTQFIGDVEADAIDKQVADMTPEEFIRKAFEQ